MESRAIVALTLLLAACGGTTVEGKVVDGMSGDAVGGFKLIAKATAEGVSITCMSKEAEVAEDGSFKLLDLCGGTAYSLEPDKDDIWLAEFEEIPDGGFGGPTEIKAWRAPKGSGLYKLSGSEIESLKTVADVKREPIRGSDVKVRYPSTVPNKVALIGAGDYLLIVGGGTVKDTQILPLIKSGERIFGDDDTKITMQPWSYVGIEFQDDTTFREVAAEIDTSKFLDKEHGGRSARWIPGSAVADGRYAALKDDDRRLYIMDFGSSHDEAAPAEGAGDEGGGEGKGKEGKGGKGKAK